MSFPLLHLIPLAAALMVAVIWDLTKRRIPNPVSGAIALAGIVMQWVDAGALGALGGAAAAVATVALMYVFWQRGGIGGGDVKLAGAVAIWVGLGSLPLYWLATALAGGGVAGICLLVSHGAARREIRLNLKLAALHQTMPEVAPVAPGRVSVPYGVAIALGAAFVVWWRLR